MRLRKGRSPQIKKDQENKYVLKFYLTLKYMRAEKVCFVWLIYQHCHPVLLDVRASSLPLEGLNEDDDQPSLSKNSNSDSGYS